MRASLIRTASGSSFTADMDAFTPVFLAPGT